MLDILVILGCGSLVKSIQHRDCGCHLWILIPSSSCLLTKDHFLGFAKLFLLLMRSSVFGKRVITPVVLLFALTQLWGVCQEHRQGFVNVLWISCFLCLPFQRWRPWWVSYLCNKFINLIWTLLAPPISHIGEYPTMVGSVYYVGLHWKP